MVDRNETGPRLLAIFDVCNTLYSANTTAGFISFVHRDQGHRLATLVVLLVRNRWSPLRYLLILAGRLQRRDLPRDLLIRTLRGLEHSALEELARRYVSEDLPGRCVVPVQAELERRREAGAGIYLASSSLDPVIRAIADELHAEGFVASELGFTGGRCTGSLNRDLTGDKLMALEGECAMGEGDQLFVCSDNATDASLFERAQEKMVVVNGGRMPESLDFEDAVYVHLD